MVFLAEIGNRFVVKRFAEAVGVVAQVGVESVGQCVALGLEKKAYAVVFGEGLIDDRGGAVGRNNQREKRRFFWLHSQRRLFVDRVSGQLFVVLLHVALVLVAEVLMQRLSEMTAQGEPSFASRCGSGDVEEQIGMDRATVVDPVDIRSASGNDRERAEDEDVSILIRMRVSDDALHDEWKVLVDGLGEGRQGFEMCGRAVRKPVGGRAVREPSEVFLIFLKFLNWLGCGRETSRRETRD